MQLNKLPLKTWLRTDARKSRDLSCRYVFSWWIFFRSFDIRQILAVQREATLKRPSFDYLSRTGKALLHCVSSANIEY